MKKIILSVAVVLSATAFAQKKEITAAVKAVDAGDYATATTQISAADAALNGKMYLLEPAVQEQYYYAKGLALLKAGKTAEGASYLAKMNDLSRNKIFTGKNGKEKVFYVGKTAADQSGVSGLKEESYTTTLAPKVGNIINPVLQTSSKEAMAAYEAKKYDVAAPKFREVYDLLNAAGQDNKQYLYYSAITYALGNNQAKAIDTYNQLINSGYTGVETTYKAKNKKSNAVETLDKTTWDLYKKAGATGEYTDFTTETSKSVEQELYETDAALMLDAGRYDEALTLIDRGLKKFPSNSKLSELQGTAYYKAGKTDEFINSLKAQTAKNPADKAAWYNLGVLASKDSARSSEAEGYFKKALEADPNYVPALQGIWYNVYMGDDEAVISKAENFRKAKKMDEYNKILDERRNRFAKGLPYVEKWYAADPNNLEVVSLLKGLYQSTRNDAKFQEFKAKEAALSKK